MKVSPLNLIPTSLLSGGVHAQERISCARAHLKEIDFHEGLGSVSSR
jgi:hypothetical protein